MEECKVIKYSEVIRVSFKYFCPEKKVTQYIKVVQPKIETRNYHDEIGDWTEKRITFKCKACKKEHTFKMT